MTKFLNTKILIVEDDVIISDYILDLLEEEGVVNVKIANTKEDAIKFMTDFLPDIILMDINLKGINSGIELSQSKNSNANVIFITGQYDFSLMDQALKTNPDAYLTKPIKRVDLLASISLAIQKKNNHTFNFKNGYDTVNLEYSDIRYFMADGNYVNILSDSKKYTIRQSLSFIIKELPSQQFKQTHRSYIVNKDKIQRVTSNSIIMNNVEIPLSRSFSKQFK